MKKKLLYLSIISSLFNFSSCAEDNLNKLETDLLCDTLTISYSQDVEPIILNNCNFSGCHSASSNNIYDATDFSAVSANANAIYGSINNGSMPENASKLPECDIAKVKKWIDDGKLNN